MPTTELMTALKIASVTFMPQWRQEFSRQAGGTPRVADIGPAIWTAKLQSLPLDNDDAVDAAAIINQMDGPLGTFYVWDPRRKYPRSDPTGAILGSYAPTLNAISSDGKSVGFAHLPTGLQINRGDKFCFDWGSPVHRAFHECATGATVDGNGTTTWIAVTPSISIGVPLYLAVSFKLPAAEMMIQPGTYDFPSAGGTTSTISFTAIQVP